MRTKKYLIPITFQMLTLGIFEIVKNSMGTYFFQIHYINFTQGNNIHLKKDDKN